MSKKQTKPYAFLVDVGKTMIEQNRMVSEGKDKQKLYCKCGGEITLNAKVRRNVVRNHDTTTEDKSSLDSITCRDCSSVISETNKVNLLRPDMEEIFDIKYSMTTFINSKGEEVITLRKTKGFAFYQQAKDELAILYKTDFIKYNKTTRQTYTFINQPANDDITSNAAANSKDSANVSEAVCLSKLDRMSTFFKFYEFVFYSGIDQAFNFIVEVTKSVPDAESAKRIGFVAFAHKNSEIIYETDSQGYQQMFQMKDDGFGMGVKAKKRLNVGDYLTRLRDMSELFFSMASFPSIATIFMTKDYKFMRNLLTSEHKCNPNVYKFHEATFPAKILEVSTNFSTNGSKRNSEKNRPADFYLKISPVIYKNIREALDMSVLLNVTSKGYLSKTEIETLFQQYERERLYKLFKAMEKQMRDEIRLTMKHVIHILKANIDNTPNEFLQHYVDTIRAITNLEMEPNYIFGAKNYKEMKEMHDDLAARYNAVKDKEKAKFYLKAVADFPNANMVIGDVEFTVVPTLEGLNKEGMTMGHCVYTYLSRVCDRKYLAVHVQHLISNERATLGLYRNSDLEFDQLKGYQNSRASHEMIEATIEYMKKNKISNKHNNSDLQPSPSSQKRMQDYLKDEEVAKIRAEREKEARKKKAEGRDGDGEDKPTRKK